MITSSIVNGFWTHKLFENDTKLVDKPSKFFCSMMGILHLTPAYGALRVIRTWWRIGDRSAEEVGFHKTVVAFRTAAYFDATGESILQTVISMNFLLFRRLGDSSMNEQDGLIILASLVLSIFTVSLAQMQYSCMDRGIMKGCPESDGYIVMALAFLDFVCQLLLRALFIVPIFFFNWPRVSSTCAACSWLPSWSHCGS